MNQTVEANKTYPIITKYRNDTPSRLEYRRRIDEDFEWLFEKSRSEYYLDRGFLERKDGKKTARLRRAYKGWKGVIEEFNRRYPENQLDYGEIKKRSRTRANESIQKHTLESILLRVLDHYIDGVEKGDPHYLSYENMKQVDPFLVHYTTRKMLKSWKDTLLTASGKFRLNLYYDEIRGFLTTEKLANLIKEIGKKDQLQLFTGKIIDSNPVIYYRAEQPIHFGRWIKGVTAQGFDYKEIRRIHYEQVRKERLNGLKSSLFEFFQQGEVLEREVIFKLDRLLVQNVESKRNFGKFDYGVSEAIRDNLQFAIVSGLGNKAIQELARIYRSRGYVGDISDLPLNMKYQILKAREILDKIVTEYLPMIKGIARREYNLKFGQGKNTFPIDDLVNEGVIGLIKALETHDFRNRNFKKYASIRIYGYIKDANLYKRDQIRIPESGQRNRKKVLKLIKTAKMYGESLTEQEIALELGLSLDSVRGALIKQPKSLEETVKRDNFEEDAVSEDMFTVSPEDVYIKKEKEEMLRKAMNRLTPRERKVLKLIFNEEYVQPEAGKKLGVTQSRISKIQTKALEKIRKYRKIGILKELYE